jgi:hypothetical protein
MSVDYLAEHPGFRELRPDLLTPKRQRRTIPGALSPEEQKRRMRDFCNRRRKSEGKPPIGEKGKKRRLNKRKNAKRRKRLLIGPGRQRVSGVALIRRGDGRTMNVRQKKADRTWIDRKEWHGPGWLPYREYKKRERAHDRLLDQWTDPDLEAIAPAAGTAAPAELGPQEAPSSIPALTLTPRLEHGGARRASFSAGRLTLRPANQT